MLARCRATVADAMPSSTAMARFDRPRVTSAAISSSRAVSSGSRVASRSGTVRASSTAASLLSSDPAAHSSLTSASLKLSADDSRRWVLLAGASGRPACRRSAAAAAASRTARSWLPCAMASAANVSRPLITAILLPVDRLSSMLSVRCWPASSSSPWLISILPMPARQRAISGLAPTSRRIGNASW